MQKPESDTPSAARAKEYFSYNAETGDLSRRPSGRRVGCANHDGYVKVFIDGKYYSAHRVIWLIMTGEWPVYPQFEIDHINGDRGDNRWVNLRKVTKTENQRNTTKRVNNKSGVHGVNWKKRGNGGRWVARIWNGPRHVYLGQFETLQEAEIARKAAERVLGHTVKDGTT